MSHFDAEKVARVAELAADQAGVVLMELYGRAQIEYKGEIDLVTEADKKAEELIVGVIREHFPEHGIFGEESGAHDEGSAAGEICWYIDPIDGTTNYAHGLPLFAVSIGVAVRNRVEVAVVYNPAYNEKYVARRGGGAFFNGKPMRVSQSPELRRSLLTTGFPYDTWKSEENNLDHYAAFQRECRGVRRLGSAALDLAYVARGVMDGYWEAFINSWDIAAGWLLVEEAGGKVTDLKGGPLSLPTRQILATNGLIHDEMIEILRRGKTGMSLSSGGEGAGGRTV